MAVSGIGTTVRTDSGSQKHAVDGGNLSSKPIDAETDASSDASGAMDGAYSPSGNAN
jgi:hypothetical protein